MPSSGLAGETRLDVGAGLNVAEEGEPVSKSWLRVAQGDTDGAISHLYLLLPDSSQTSDLTVPHL